MQFERRLREGVHSGRIAHRRRGRAVAGLLAFAVACGPASLGADLLLHPGRKPITRQPALPFEAVELEGAGVTLKGWWFHGARKGGTVVFLHGTGDNREAGLGVVEHFVGHGFEAIAYDSRAHGESGGDMCTYGFHEKHDLRRVLDRVERRPIIVVGFSMGAAIALQAAAEDDRISAVVAASSFSDLRTAVLQRAPFFATARHVAAVFRVAEEKAQFRVDEVSPVAAAPRIRAPTLLIHGDRDGETPREHSQRIFAALRASKRLIAVPGGGHSYIIDAGVWRQIDDWLDEVLSPAPARDEGTPDREGAGHARP
jgi:alpha-beta hydrolase superfamily lysophospholipase